MHVHRVPGLHVCLWPFFLPCLLFAWYMRLKRRMQMLQMLNIAKSFPSYVALLDCFFTLSFEPEYSIDLVVYVTETLATHADAPNAEHRYISSVLCRFA